MAKFLGSLCLAAFGAYLALWLGFIPGEMIVRSDLEFPMMIGTGIAGFVLFFKT